MLSGKCAVVTGSTSGIGLGIARALAGEGANIMLNGFGDAQEIERLRAALAAEFKVKVAYNAADLTQPAQVRDMIAAATREFGAVDILVNNAGIQYTARVEDFPEDRWDAVIAARASEEATMSGFDAGTRTNADVLRSLEERFDAERTYSDARYLYILDSLRLKLAAGNLVASDLAPFDRLLRTASESP
jgi:NAD(P)-dependent dehydrogenase (short-subunit alcohol dehydrogenase family)